MADAARHPANGTAAFSRRRLLALTAGGATAAILAACGGETATIAPTIAPTRAVSATSAGAPTAGATTAPAAIPATAASASGGTTAAATSAPSAAAAVDGKITSTVSGVPDAFTKNPNPTKTYDGKPGRGGTITAFTIAYQSPPPPRENNPYWQELEKRLGVKWEPIITPQPEYGAKSAALIAGDIPDLFYLNPGQNAAPQYRAMEQGAFTDLTPFVTGDALKEYKNLATFPPYMWDNVKFKGKLYGVPKPLQRNGNIPFYRGDWAKKVGLAAPKNPDDLRTLLVAFAKMDPDGNGQADTYGMGKYGTDWNAWDNYMRNMFGVPFNWRKNPDGTMTHMIETDEYRQTLDYLRQLNAAGAYHPDAGGMNYAQAKGFFEAGKTGLHTEGFGSLVNPKSGVYLNVLKGNPNAEVVGLLPPAASGRTSVTYNTQGSFGFTGIAAKVGRDRERVKELLRVLDYLAAPFGSEEYNFLINGIEGTHHDIRADGARIINDRGRSDKGDLVYLMASLPVFYYPESPGLAEQVQKQAAEIIRIGQDNPEWVLYSPTNVMKAGELNTFGLDRASAIVTGREPLSTLDTAIRDWRSRGGDMIRKEFEQSLKENG